MFTVRTRIVRSLHMQEAGRRSPTQMGFTATPDAKSPVPQHELTVLATVAHELRGPLTALATSSELLAEDFAHLDPQQVKGMLSAMHRRTLWLQGLVENLLCAATIREGRLQLYRQSLSLADLLADVESVVSPIQRLAIQLQTPFADRDRKSTRLNSSHMSISYAVFCLK